MPDQLPGSLSFVTLWGLQDDLLLPWLDLYETAFPPIERVLVSFFLRGLKEKSAGVEQAGEMLAALDGRHHLVGIADYEFHPSPGYTTLWYLAVSPMQRNTGIGSSIYQEVVRRATGSGCKALLFEVEDPGDEIDPEARRFTERRIAFYRRQGARVFRGIHYLQFVGPHQPLKSMNLMIHPFQPIDSADALKMAVTEFGDYLTQVGEVTLD